MWDIDFGTIERFLLSQYQREQGFFMEMKTAFDRGWESLGVAHSPTEIRRLKEHIGRHVDRLAQAGATPADFEGLKRVVRETPVTFSSAAHDLELAIMERHIGTLERCMGAWSNGYSWVTPPIVYAAARRIGRSQAAREVFALQGALKGRVLDTRLCRNRLPRTKTIIHYLWEGAVVSLILDVNKVSAKFWD